MTHSISGQQRPLRISFSGIDGAGKSTQIDLLHDRLTASAMRVKLVAFWDDVAIFTRVRETAVHSLFKGEKGVGSPDRPVNRRDKNVRTWYMTAMRFVLYFLEALSLAKVALASCDADVIIFDRYLYDQLANLPQQRFFTRLYSRLLLKLVPKPDIAYLIDADPEFARQRKPEYPLEFLRTIRSAYLILKDIGGMTLIPPGPVNDVADNVLKAFQQKLQNCVPVITLPRISEQAVPPQHPATSPFVPAEGRH
jgi:thymidylate kinase